MNKPSFFKLPLVFITAFILISLVERFIRFSYDLYSGQDSLLGFLFKQLFLICECMPLFVFVVASAFYSIKVNIFNLRNIVITIFIAFVIFVFQKLYSVFVYPMIFDEVLKQYYYKIESGPEFIIRSLFITRLCVNFIEMALAYILIKGCVYFFDYKKDNNFTIKQIQSIHFNLCVLLFAGINLLLMITVFKFLPTELLRSFKLNYDIFQFTSIIFTIVNTAIMSVLIVYLFTKPYEIVRIGRVLKVVCFTYLTTLLINIVVSLFSAYILSGVMSHMYYRYNTGLIEFILISSAIVQYVIFLVVTRFFVKQNFAISKHNSNYEDLLGDDKISQGY
ncbi:hypothetical protein RCS94_04300 [Orbaceae bacterium ac157xtp]